MIKRLILKVVTLAFTAGSLSVAVGADVYDSINTLTGMAQTRLVWVNGLDGGTSNNLLWGGGAIIGMDTKDKVTKQIVAAASGQRRPILCSGGNKVVYNVGGSSTTTQVKIINFDGTGGKTIMTGFCSDVWVDPATSKEWLVIRTGVYSNATSCLVTRYMMDDITQKVPLWTNGGAGFDYTDWFMISADGKVASDLLMWPNYFILLNGGTAVHRGIDPPSADPDRVGAGTGCWSSTTADNSYISYIFPNGGDSGHVTFRVLKDTLLLHADVPITAPRPSGSILEYYHPRAASQGGRFLTLTSGYTRGASGNNMADVCIGKWNTAFSGFAGWVRIGRTNADYYPDAWVGVGTVEVGVRHATGSAVAASVGMATYVAGKGLVVNAGNKSAVVEITGVNGRLVLLKVVTGNGAIVGRNLPAGLYTARIRDGGSVRVSPFMVSRL